MSYATVVNGRPDEQHTDPDNPFGFDPKTLEDPNLYAAEIDARTIILVAPQAKRFVPDSVSLKAVLEVDDFKYHKIVSFSRTGDNRWTIMVNSIILAEKFNNTTMRIGDIIYRFSGIHEATLITIQIDERIHNKLIIEKLNDSCEIINIKHKYHIFAKNIRTNKRVILIRWKKDVTRLTKISILGRSYQLYYKGMKTKTANENAQKENDPETTIASATHTLPKSSNEESNKEEKTSMKPSSIDQTPVQDTTNENLVYNDKQNESINVDINSSSQQESSKLSNNCTKKSNITNEINVDARIPSNPLLNDAGLTPNQVSQIRNQIFMKRNFESREDELEHLIGPLLFSFNREWSITIYNYVNGIKTTYVPETKSKIIDCLERSTLNRTYQPINIMNDIGINENLIPWQKHIIEKYLR